MKKILSIVLVTAFTLNQAVFASTVGSMKTSSVMKKMMLAHAKASFGSLTSEQTFEMTSNTLKELDQAQEVFGNMSDKEFNEFVKPNVIQANETAMSPEMISSLSESEKELLLSTVDDETKLVVNTDSEAIMLKLNAESAIRKAKFTSEINHLTKNDVLYQVKEMKESIKSKGLITTLLAGFGTYGTYAAGIATGFFMTNIVTISIIFAVVALLFIVGLVLWIVGMVKKNALMAGFGGSTFGFMALPTLVGVAGFILFI